MAVRSIRITGYSRGGAGAALARKFHQNGFRVFATARAFRKIQHLEVDGVKIAEVSYQI